MFSWAIAFFVIALIAAVFGFFGLAASAAGIAKIIFVVAHPGGHQLRVRPSDSRLTRLESARADQGQKGMTSP